MSFSVPTTVRCRGVVALEITAPKSQETSSVLDKAATIDRPDSSPIRRRMVALQLRPRDPRQGLVQLSDDP